MQVDSNWQLLDLTQALSDVLCTACHFADTFKFTPDEPGCAYALPPSLSHSARSLPIVRKSWIWLRKISFKYCRKVLVYIYIYYIYTFNYRLQSDSGHDIAELEVDLMMIHTDEHEEESTREEEIREFAVLLEVLVWNV